MHKYSFAAVFSVAKPVQNLTGLGPRPWERPVNYNDRISAQMARNTQNSPPLVYIVPEPAQAYFLALPHLPTLSPANVPFPAFT